MAAAQSDPRIELQAARAAVEWKNLFAEELDVAARQIANGAELVTAEHYRQALPIATSRILDAIESHRNKSSNVQQRAA
jgi:hypothetical protein